MATKIEKIVEEMNAATKVPFEYNGQTYELNELVIWGKDIAYEGRTFKAYTASFGGTEFEVKFTKEVANVIPPKSNNFKIVIRVATSFGAGNNFQVKKTTTKSGKPYEKVILWVSKMAKLEEIKRTEVVDDGLPF